MKGRIANRITAHNTGTTTGPVTSTGPAPPTDVFIEFKIGRGS
jgi:hypothetical protein